MSLYSKCLHILLISGIIALCTCCNSGSSNANNYSKERKDSTEIQDHGCIASYELNSTGDTINKSFADGTKHGHWIHYEFIHESMKKKNNGDPNEGSRIGKYIHQEGTYIYGKKAGVWKTYDKTGLIIDSTLYPGTSDIGI